LYHFKSRKVLHSSCSVNRLINAVDGWMSEHPSHDCQLRS
jgi:hypothetical protein